MSQGGSPAAKRAYGAHGGGNGPKKPKSMRYTGSRNATRLYEKNAQSIYQVF